MKQWFFAAFLLCASSLSLTDQICLAARLPQDGPKGAASGKRKELPIVVLEGSPFERGKTHGRTLKEQIRKLIDRWKADVREAYDTDPDPLIKRFVQKTSYSAAIKKWTPDLLDEIKGLAEGAGIDFDTMFAFQLVDEFWVHADALVGQAFQPASGAERQTGKPDLHRALHCSSLGFSKRGKEPACVAQNLDLDTYYDGFQIVLHIKHQGSNIEEFVVTCAGCIGSNGMNNRSIGVCSNTLAGLASCQDGLPVACVIRGVLQQRTEADAVAFVERVKHATGQNYMIGGPEHAYSFECSANKVVRYKPAGQDAVVWHSNHPLVNTDNANGHKNRQERNEDKEGLENSKARLQCLERRLGKGLGGNWLARIKETLASHDSDEHPVCGSGGNHEYFTKIGLFTFAATIMVLSDEPHLYIAPGPPDRTAYQKLTFVKATR